MHYVEESVMLIQGIMLLIRFTATTAHLISYTPLPSHSPLSLTLPSPPPPASCFFVVFFVVCFLSKKHGRLVSTPNVPWPPSPHHRFILGTHLVLPSNWKIQFKKQVFCLLQLEVSSDAPPDVKHEFLKKKYPISSYRPVGYFLSNGLAEGRIPVEIGKVSELRIRFIGQKGKNWIILSDVSTCGTPLRYLVYCGQRVSRWTETPNRSEHL